MGSFLNSLFRTFPFCVLNTAAGGGEVFEIIDPSFCTLTYRLCPPRNWRPAPAPMFTAKVEHLREQTLAGRRNPGNKPFGG